MADLEKVARVHECELHEVQLDSAILHLDVFL